MSWQRFTFVAAFVAAVTLAIITLIAALRNAHELDVAYADVKRLARDSSELQVELMRAQKDLEDLRMERNFESRGGTTIYTPKTGDKRVVGIQCVPYYLDGK